MKQEPEPTLYLIAPRDHCIRESTQGMLEDALKNTKDQTLRGAMMLFWTEEGVHVLSSRGLTEVELLGMLSSAHYEIAHGEPEIQEPDDLA